MFLLFFSAIQMKFIPAASLPVARYLRLDQQKPKQLFVFIEYKDDVGQSKLDLSHTWNLMTAIQKELKGLS